MVTRSYRKPTGLVVEKIRTDSATYSQKAHPEKSCKEAIDHDTLKVFRYRDCKLEDHTPKTSNDKGYSATNKLAQWSPYNRPIVI